jgi:hypothetical protein
MGRVRGYSGLGIWKVEDDIDDGRGLREVHREHSRSCVGTFRGSKNSQRMPREHRVKNRKLTKPPAIST